MFDPDEIVEIMQLQVALLLHKTPEEVDAMPIIHMRKVLDMYNANQEIFAWQMKHR